MGVIKEQAEKFWNGEITVAQQHPLTSTGEYEEVAAGVMFYRWFANFTAVKTEEGIVLVDTGAFFNQAETVAMVRRFGPERINTAIYTHGHVDHALGMAAFIAEGQKNKVAWAIAGSWRASIATSGQRDITG
jgi:glyoxylase-like metal-dependent hydrolase (beta-lactamase superfamily II)